MLIIYNAKIIDRDNNGFGFVVCEQGKISCVKICNNKKPNIPGACESDYLNAEGLTLMPAFIDMHAHFRYPGQPQKEDLDTGLAAARNGGFGTLVLMPNTNPVISSYQQAKAIMKEAASKKMSNIFQTTSITNNFQGKDTFHINDLNSKEFPIITEDGHDVLNSAVMLDGMKKAAEKGIIVSCHCEDPDLSLEAKIFRQNALAFMKEYGISAWGIIPSTIKIPENIQKEISHNLTKANDLLKVAEDTYTFRNLELANLAGCHIHICHCSTQTSIQAVREAKKKNYNCTVEITPHHIALTGDKFPEILALVNPPLRSETDRRALIEALRDGTADTISTDHAPHTFEDKATGAPGFTGLETAFAVCNTILCKQENFSINKLSELMSTNAAKILGLQKGLIKETFDADLVLVDENEKWTVKASDFASKGKASPFENKELIGKVKKLIVNGKII